MTRIRRGIIAHKRHQKVLASTKGFKHGRHNIFRLAKQAALKAGQYAYRDRRNKKRDFRRLWIVKVNAAVRLHDMSYKDFIYGLRLADIKLNRKVLSELAVQNTSEFDKIVAKASQALKKHAEKK